MRIFYECGFSERISALIFLLFDIMSLLYLDYRLISERREKRKIIISSILFAGAVILYCILQNDHIPPIDAEIWKGPEIQLQMMELWAVFVAILIYTSAAIMKDAILTRKEINLTAIKKALDNIPTGIACFREDGLPVLVNKTMYRLSEMISGKVFASEHDFVTMITGAACHQETSDIYRLSDGSTWRYQEYMLETEDGKFYRSVAMFNVTELSSKKEELEAKQKDLEKMAAQIKKLGNNIQQLAREEEMLSIKSAWHDAMGEGLTAVRRQFLAVQTDADLDTAIRNWQKAVTLIRKDNEATTQAKDVIGDLMRDAIGVGVELIVEGDMPEENAVREVFLIAIRNCLTNAVQHAKATELKAVITNSDKEHSLSVTNNGLIPKKEIVLHGGLLNVRNHTERIGGRFCVQSKPCFELIICIPAKE